jgi:hypothetical protein
MSCLSDDEVSEFVEGRLSAEQSARVDRHMAGCAACRGLVADLARITFDDARADAPSSSPPTRVPQPGDLVGRYRLREILGVGGMGMVYAADDPELHRTIALKLIRTDVITASGAELESRLRQEALAMAKISHPNVVVVHDIGTIGGHLFVAMEYVRGKTLRAWCASDGRTQPEIVEAFIAAGNGLVAAHAAGLVHRDFKPENVLCGDDGRVRVTDFGLARGELQIGDPSFAEQPLELLAHDEGGSSSPSFATVTRAGQILGTPAYMAPEQLLGSAADARSDQFSFCVALFEALYKARPFPAKDVRELARKMALGELAHRPPDASNAKVSARLHSIIARGLRYRSPERFPSMQALLDELAAFRTKMPPHRARKGSIAVWTALAALVAFSLLVAFGIWQKRRVAVRPAGPQECPRGAGLYCAGHGVEGAQATLYRCSSEGVSEAKKCAAACLYLLGGAVDSCDLDSPKCPIGNGLYCGGNHLSADPKALYKCVGGTVMVEESCTHGCVKEPDGKKDHCE